MKSNPWLLLALGLALGFAAGRGVAPARDAVPQRASVAQLEAALEDRDWLRRSVRLAGFLEQLDPDNLPAALAVLEPALPWLSTDELRLFMLAWSRFDARGALEQALAWPRPWNRNAAGAAMYAWAYRDPQAALAALASVSAGDLRDLMEGRLIAGWAHRGEASGVNEYLTSLPRGPRRFKYIGMLAWELSKRGPEAVQEWAEDAPSAFPDYKAAVFLKASTTLAATDPAGTARWLEPHLERPYADGVLRVLTRSWATHDPRAALHWLEQRPAGARRDASISNAFRVWYDQEPEAAAAWLRSATPAAPFDAAVSALVGQSLLASPAGAMQWAGRIADPGLREQVQSNLAQRWLRRDRPAAQAWLAQSLPPERVQRILQQAEVAEP